LYVILKEGAVEVLHRVLLNQYELTYEREDPNVYVYLRREDQKQDQASMSTILN
jgi:hypothetical protein